MTLDWLPADLRPLVASATEPQRVAATLWAESRSEKVEGIIAVANVIRNRVQADLGKDGKPDWWGEGYSGVCLAPHQFSCWTPAGGQRNYDRLVTLLQQFVAKTPITDPAVRECIGIAHLIMGDYLRDNTHGATHYHVATMTPRPKWAKGHTPAIQISAHVFYVGIP
jgi:hypothetical protein